MHNYYDTTSNKTKYKMQPARRMNIGDQLHSNQILIAEPSRITIKLYPEIYLHVLLFYLFSFGKCLFKAGFCVHKS